MIEPAKEPQQLVFTERPPVFETELEKRFWNFHRENPNVYILFSRFTKELITRGFRHYSADAVMHRVRWETSIETKGDPFKINNNHIAYYARLFMNLNKEHLGFFRTRG